LRAARRSTQPVDDAKELSQFGFSVLCLLRADGTPYPLVRHERNIRSSRATHFPDAVSFP
jgi:hypothetical protein